MPASVRVGNWSRIGAACTVVPAADFDAATDDDGHDVQRVLETLPDRTVIFGAGNRRRLWSGEGAGQAHALYVCDARAHALTARRHVKHITYLREMLPRYSKLRLVVPPS